MFYFSIFPCIRGAFTVPSLLFSALLRLLSTFTKHLPRTSSSFVQRSLIIQSDIIFRLITIHTRSLFFNFSWLLTKNNVRIILKAIRINCSSSLTYCLSCVSIPIEFRFALPFGPCVRPPFRSTHKIVFACIHLSFRMHSLCIQGLYVKSLQKWHIII